jgi:hypothetical protein
VNSEIIIRKFSWNYLGDPKIDKMIILIELFKKTRGFIKKFSWSYLGDPKIDKMTILN